MVETDIGISEQSAVKDQKKLDWEKLLADDRNQFDMQRVIKQHEEELRQEKLSYEDKLSLSRKEANTTKADKAVALPGEPALATDQTSETLTSIASLYKQVDSKNATIQRMVEQLFKSGHITQDTPADQAVLIAQKYVASKAQLIKSPTGKEGPQSLEDTLQADKTSKSLTIKGDTSDVAVVMMSMATAVLEAIGTSKQDISKKLSFVDGISGGNEQVAVGYAAEDGNQYALEGRKQKNASSMSQMPTVNSAFEQVQFNTTKPQLEEELQLVSIRSEQAAAAGLAAPEEPLHSVGSLYQMADPNNTTIQQAVDYLLEQGVITKDTPLDEVVLIAQQFLSAHTQYVKELSGKDHWQPLDETITHDKLTNQLLFQGDCEDLAIVMMSMATALLQAIGVPKDEITKKLFFVGGQMQGTDHVSIGYWATDGNFYDLEAAQFNITSLNKLSKIGDVFEHVLFSGNEDRSVALEHFEPANLPSSWDSFWSNSSYSIGSTYSTSTTDGTDDEGYPSTSSWDNTPDTWPLGSESTGSAPGSSSFSGSKTYKTGTPPNEVEHTHSWSSSSSWTTYYYKYYNPDWVPSITSPSWAGQADEKVTFSWSSGDFNSVLSTTNTAYRYNLASDQQSVISSHYTDSVFKNESFGGNAIAVIGTWMDAHHSLLSGILNDSTYSKQLRILALQHMNWADMPNTSQWDVYLNKTTSPDYDYQNTAGSRLTTAFPNNYLCSIAKDKAHYIDLVRADALGVATFDNSNMTFANCNAIITDGLRNDSTYWGDVPTLIINMLDRSYAASSANVPCSEMVIEARSTANHWRLRQWSINHIIPRSSIMTIDDIQSWIDEGPNAFSNPSNKINNAAIALVGRLPDQATSRWITATGTDQDYATIALHSPPYYHTIQAWAIRNIAVPKSTYYTIDQLQGWIDSPYGDVSTAAINLIARMYNNYIKPDADYAAYARALSDSIPPKVDAKANVLPKYYHAIRAWAIASIQTPEKTELSVDELNKWIYEKVWDTATVSHQVADVNAAAKKLVDDGKLQGNMILPQVDYTRVAKDKNFYAGIREWSINNLQPTYYDPVKLAQVPPVKVVMITPQDINKLIYEKVKIIDQDGDLNTDQAGDTWGGYNLKVTEAAKKLLNNLSELAPDGVTHISRMQKYMIIPDIKDPSPPYEMITSANSVYADIAMNRPAGSTYYPPLRAWAIGHVQPNGVDLSLADLESLLDDSKDKPDPDVPPKYTPDIIRKAAENLIPLVDRYMQVYNNDEVITVAKNIKDKAVLRAWAVDHVQFDPNQWNYNINKAYEFDANPGIAAAAMRFESRADYNDPGRVDSVKDIWRSDIYDAGTGKYKFDQVYIDKIKPLFVNIDGDPLVFKTTGNPATDQTNYDAITESRVKKTDLQAYLDGAAKEAALNSIFQDTTKDMWVFKPNQSWSDIKNKLSGLGAADQTSIKAVIKPAFDNLMPVGLKKLLDLGFAKFQFNNLIGGTLNRNDLTPYSATGNYAKIKMLFTNYDTPNNPPLLTFAASVNPFDVNNLPIAPELKSKLLQALSVTDKSGGYSLDHIPNPPSSIPDLTYGELFPQFLTSKYKIDTLFEDIEKPGGVLTFKPTTTREQIYDVCSNSLSLFCKLDAAFYNAKIKSMFEPDTLVFKDTVTEDDIRYLGNNSLSHSGWTGYNAYFSNEQTQGLIHALNVSRMEGGISTLSYANKLTIIDDYANEMSASVVAMKTLKWTDMGDTDQARMNRADWLYRRYKDVKDVNDVPVLVTALDGNFMVQKNMQDYIDSAAWDKDSRGDYVKSAVHSQQTRALVLSRTPDADTSVYSYPEISAIAADGPILEKAVSRYLSNRVVVLLNVLTNAAVMAKATSAEDAVVRAIDVRHTYFTATDWPHMLPWLQASGTDDPAVKQAAAEYLVKQLSLDHLADILKTPANYTHEAVLQALRNARYDTDPKSTALLGWTTINGLLRYNSGDSDFDTSVQDLTAQYLLPQVENYNKAAVFLDISNIYSKYVRAYASQSLQYVEKEISFDSFKSIIESEPDQLLRQTAANSLLPQLDATQQREIYNNTTHADVKGIVLRTAKSGAFSFHAIQTILDGGETDSTKVNVTAILSQFSADENLTIVKTSAYSNSIRIKAMSNIKLGQSGWAESDLLDFLQHETKDNVRDFAAQTFLPQVGDADLITIAGSAAYIDDIRAAAVRSYQINSVADWNNIKPFLGAGYPDVVRNAVIQSVIPKLANGYQTQLVNDIFTNNDTLYDWGVTYNAYTQIGASARTVAAKYIKYSDMSTILGGEPAAWSWVQTFLDGRNTTNVHCSAALRAAVSSNLLTQTSTSRKLDVALLHTGSLSTEAEKGVLFNDPFNPGYGNNEMRLQALASIKEDDLVGGDVSRALSLITVVKDVGDTLSQVRLQAALTLIPAIAKLGGHNDALATIMAQTILPGHGGPYYFCDVMAICAKYIKFDDVSSWSGLPGAGVTFGFNALSDLLGRLSAFSSSVVWNKDAVVANITQYVLPQVDTVMQVMRDTSSYVPFINRIARGTLDGTSYNVDYLLQAEAIKFSRWVPSLDSSYDWPQIKTFMAKPTNTADPVAVKKADTLSKAAADSLLSKATAVPLREIAKGTGYDTIAREKAIDLIQVGAGFTVAIPPLVSDLDTLLRQGDTYGQATRQYAAKILLANSAVPNAYRQYIINNPGLYTDPVVRSYAVSSLAMGTPPAAAEETYIKGLLAKTQVDEVVSAAVKTLLSKLSQSSLSEICKDTTTYGEYVKISALNLVQYGQPGALTWAELDNATETAGHALLLRSSSASIRKAACSVFSQTKMEASHLVDVAFDNSAVYQDDVRLSAIGNVKYSETGADGKMTWAQLDSNRLLRNTTNDDIRYAAARSILSQLNDGNTTENAHLAAVAYSNPAIYAYKKDVRLVAIGNVKYTGEAGNMKWDDLNSTRLIKSTDDDIRLAAAKSILTQLNGSEDIENNHLADVSRNNGDTYENDVRAYALQTVSYRTTMNWAAIDSAAVNHKIIRSGVSAIRTAMEGDLMSQLSNDHLATIAIGWDGGYQFELDARLSAIRNVKYGDANMNWLTLNTTNLLKSGDASIRKQVGTYILSQGALENSHLAAIVTQQGYAYDTDVRIAAVKAVKYGADLKWDSPSGQCVKDLLKPPTNSTLSYEAAVALLPQVRSVDPAKVIGVMGDSSYSNDIRMAAIDCLMAGEVKDYSGQVATVLKDTTNPTVQQEAIDKLIPLMTNAAKATIIKDVSYPDAVRIAAASDFNNANNDISMPGDWNAFIDPVLKVTSGKDALRLAFESYLMKITTPDILLLIAVDPNITTDYSNHVRNSAISCMKYPANVDWTDVNTLLQFTKTEVPIQNSIAYYILPKLESSKWDIIIGTAGTPPGSSQNPDYSLVAWSTAKALKAANP